MNAALLLSMIAPQATGITGRAAPFGGETAEGDGFVAIMEGLLEEAGGAEATADVVELLLGSETTQPQIAGQPAAREGEHAPEVRRDVISLLRTRIDGGAAPVQALKSLIAELDMPSQAPLAAAPSAESAPALPEEAVLPRPMSEYTAATAPSPSAGVVPKPTPEVADRGAPPDTALSLAPEPKQRVTEKATDAPAGSPLPGIPALPATAADEAAPPPHAPEAVAARLAPVEPQTVGAERAAPLAPAATAPLKTAPSRRAEGGTPQDAAKKTAKAAPASARAGAANATDGSGSAPPARAATSEVPSARFVPTQSAAPEASADLLNGARPQSSDGPPLPPLSNLTSTAPRIAGDTFAASLMRHMPSAAHPAAQQVAVEISHRVQTGERKFVIRLDPPELGRVEVRLTLADDRPVQALLTADKDGALDVLQRDARVLERALNDAGLKTDSGSLNFSLKEGRDQAMARHQSGSGAEAEADVERDEDMAPVDEAAILQVSDRPLDLTI